MQDTLTHGMAQLHCDTLLATCLLASLRSLRVCLVSNAVCMLQVHRKRFAVLTRFVDELEASLNPEEMHVLEHSKPGATDQSDRDSSERSMQG